MNNINPNDLKSEIKDNIRTGLNTMIWGGPGIGKSDIPQQVADDLDIPLLDFRANLFDPVDVRGIPHIMQEQETGKRFTRWAVPDCFLLHHVMAKRVFSSSTNCLLHHQLRRTLSCNSC